MHIENPILFWNNLIKSHSCQLKSAARTIISKNEMINSIQILLLRKKSTDRISHQTYSQWLMRIASCALIRQSDENALL